MYAFHFGWLGDVSFDEGETETETETETERFRQNREAMINMPDKQNQQQTNKIRVKTEKVFCPATFMIQGHHEPSKANTARYIYLVRKACIQNYLTSIPVQAMVVCSASA